MAAAASIVALRLTSIAARPVLSISKAGKIINVGSKTSKTVSQSLSMSMAHTEFGLFDESSITSSSPSSTPSPFATESSGQPIVPSQSSKTVNSINTYHPSEERSDSHAGLFDEYAYAIKTAPPSPSQNGGSIPSSSPVSYDESYSEINNSDDCTIEDGAVFGPYVFELQYFYRLETKALDPSTLSKVEHKLLERVCNVIEKRRFLTSNITDQYAVAVSESPEDVVSNTCECASPTSYLTPISRSLTHSSVYRQLPTTRCSGTVLPSNCRRVDVDSQG